MANTQRTLPRWAKQWWVWFAAAFIITFVSFWPSFFSAIVDVQMHIIIHGVSATAWMLLTVVQASLIKSRWRKHHRMVGYVSIALAAAVVLSGLRVLQTMVLRDRGDADGGSLLTMEFFYLDLTGLVLFCAFLYLAIQAARQRYIGLHLRLIACTAIIPLEAVLERTYMIAMPTLVPTFAVGLIASEVTLIVLMVVLIVGEWRYARIRWPFAFMLAYYVVMMLTQEGIAGADWFISAANYYANL